MIYLDNAATTKPCDEAKAAVMKGLEVFGNPSSLHRAGLDAELLVSDAREIIADALGVTPRRGQFHFRCDRKQQYCYFRGLQGSRKT